MSYRFFIAAVLGTSILAGADPALTIYNQNFAVVREGLPLDLKAGLNHIRQTGLTAQVEPASVILRDPAGKIAIQILEQNYLADPVSMQALLSFYEGKTIEFQLNDGKIVSGRIIRAGIAVTPGPPTPSPAFVPAVAVRGNQALIESEGKLRFGLPGVPLFPGLSNDSILQPTLDWLIRADRPAKLDAELGYVTGGFNWKADYNVVAAEDSDTVQLIGWVTIDNRSGKQFENARIALMAGDVNKLQPQAGRSFVMGGLVAGAGGASFPGAPPVEEKSFDDYHLYQLQNAPLFLTAKPSRWNSSGPTRSPPNGSTSTTAHRLTTANIGTGTMIRSETARSTAHNRTRRSG